MRSLRKNLDGAYLKIFPIEQNRTESTEPTEPVARPINWEWPSVRKNKGINYIIMKIKKCVSTAKRIPK
jgi:hypothetical protein